METEEEVAATMLDGNLNMLPVFSINYKINSRSVDFVFFSQLGKLAIFSIVIFSYIKNLLFFQNMISRFFSRDMRRNTSPVVSIFGNAINFIVLISSQKQMFRVNARRIIAGMTNQHPLRDVAVSQFKGHSMGLNTFIFKTKMAITFFVFKGHPNPTIFASVNFAPESFHAKAIA